MEKNATRSRLFLGDRPRVEIPLTNNPVPVWLAVGLPSPLAEPRPAGRFLAEPRLPESEIMLTWGQTPAVPQALAVLAVVVGEQSWTLEQDIHEPERWRELAHHEHGRMWS
jgi:hypothetical protein